MQCYWNEFDTTQPNNISIDASWTPISVVTSVDRAVCGILVENTNGGGVIRVIGKPARYTRTDGLSGTILLVRGPGEKFLLLDPLSVRYIRHSGPQ
mgnify:CR=1 FL=1